MAQKKAILYIRVSTDEQADRGFSLKHQEDRLRQYCALQHIEVAGFYKDDHSAKTFERPEFQKLLTRLKKEKGLANLLLFLKWDRFSRNAGDAYGMINTLNRLGVEPQAIEQPLDLNVPENKIMLAFYLAAPEVENDRRALNTIAGMRRAKKDGRCVGAAPVGYKNARNERNEPVLIQTEKAPIVKWIFEELSKGIFSAEVVRHGAARRGIGIARANYYLLIKNAMYCGRMVIPAYKDEPEMVVKGLHEPIVSEELFDEVQAIMTRKKRNWPVSQTAREEFPLRGHLLCARCGAKLTASTSKGNGGKYYYYHCTTKCGERFKAEEANELFAKMLQNIKLNRVAQDAIEYFATSLYGNGGQSAGQERAKLKSEIEKNKERLSNAQQLLLDGTLDPADYKTIKNRYEPIINQQESRMRGLSQENNDLGDLLAFARKFFTRLDSLYLEGNLMLRQQLIGSMFPEKLIYEKKSFRTTAPNPLLALISRPSAGSSRRTNKKSPQYVDFSSKAPQSGLEPETL